MKPRELLPVAKQTAVEWMQDSAPTHGAALAYYTLFSLAPLLIIAIGLAGLFLGQEAAQGQIFDQLRSLVGEQGGRAMQDMVKSASSQKSSSIAATIIGGVTLVVGASTVFGQLQSCLNTVWGVQPKPGRGLRGVIKDRVLSFGLVLVIGFLLLVSLALTAVVAGVGKWMGGALPGGEFVAQTLNFVLSLAVIAALFAMIYKILPDVKIGWRDVWVGALLTALLFVVGKSALGIYLGKSSIASSFGAAGSLIVVVVWVYYSTQILIFGAEFTQVYANRFGSHVEPADNALRVGDAAAAATAEAAAARARQSSYTKAHGDGVDAGELKRQLASSRIRLSHHTAQLAGRVNVTRRVKESVRQKPVTWIAAGTVAGLLIAARRPRTEKVKLWKKSASAAESERKRGAFLLGAAKVVLGLGRPALSVWLQRKAARPPRNGSKRIPVVPIRSSRFESMI